MTESLFIYIVIVNSDIHVCIY